jgi:SAM-dependent methyltransferase
VGQHRRVSGWHYVSAGAWQSDVEYERFMGRWSRLATAAFVHWLDRPPGGVWIDVGMGTGALTQCVLATAQPGSVIGVEPSAEFREAARERIADRRVTVLEGEAGSIPLLDGIADTVASSFVLNFVPDLGVGLLEMRRCARPGGSVTALVWDFAEGLEFFRYFWIAAVRLDPGARERDPAARFTICRPEPLQRAFEAAGLHDVRVEPLDVETHFADLRDYWDPFLAGSGAASTYLATISAPQRRRLRAELARTLPMERDGSIRLLARAWAVIGTVATRQERA